MDTQNSRHGTIIPQNIIKELQKKLNDLEINLDKKVKEGLERAAKKVSGILYKINGVNKAITSCHEPSKNGFFAKQHENQVRSKVKEELSKGTELKKSTEPSLPLAPKQVFDRLLTYQDFVLIGDHCIANILANNLADSQFVDHSLSSAPGKLQ